MNSLQKEFLKNDAKNLVRIVQSVRSTLFDIPGSTPINEAKMRIAGEIGKLIAIADITARDIEYFVGSKKDA